MLPLFTSLESNCGVICSPLQKNPPKKIAGHFIIIFGKARCCSVSEHLLHYFFLLFSLEVNLVNTDNSFGQ